MIWHTERVQKALTGKKGSNVKERIGKVEDDRTPVGEEVNGRDRMSVSRSLTTTNS